MYRRTLMKLALMAVAGVPFLRLRVEAAITELPPKSVATLKDLAFLVLPASLGRRNTDALALKFTLWVRGYRAGVPLDHGYGNPRLRVTPPSPADGYVAQLEALETAARAKGQPFGKLAPAAQRAIIEAALAEARIDQLLQRPTGKHVAADLMAFYFQSSAANDYVYKGEIGRHRCRPLELSTKKPRPLSL